VLESRFFLDVPRGGRTNAVGEIATLANGDRVRIYLNPCERLNLLFGCIELVLLSRKAGGRLCTCMTSVLCATAICMDALPRP
jgi:hypothetical protein